jgi:hypothetical protein
MLLVMMQEEEALAQALANGNMDPQDDLLPEEDEQLGYPEDEAQQDTLEQVRTVLTYAICCRACALSCKFAVAFMPVCYEV